LDRKINAKEARDIFDYVAGKKYMSRKPGKRGEA
jgi:hypothetical protein